MDPQRKAVLEKQHYKVIGEHSAVKICHWTRESMLRDRGCYKQSFYGIESHRCMQMTPAVNQCSENCQFCWRFQDFQEDHIEVEDDPEFILEQSIQAQKRLMSGYKGDARCSAEKWEESQKPKHVAISLTGEPTAYSRLGEYIELCHRNGMTTFLVTNGTNPDVLRKLEPLPTQLYVTVAAPTKEIFTKICAPIRSNAWEQLMETLSILPSLDTRKVIRHTLVRDWTLGFEETYSKLDAIAEPHFIESKGYVHVGYSRERLSISNMPSHAEIRHFAERLGGLLGNYEIQSEREDSRVVLLVRKGVDRWLPGLKRPLDEEIRYNRSANAVTV
ncbi:MAG: 4-demethylwyosine synthase TYW1 [Thermoplasmata archaeon]|uniref:S-adenosyl-L-methionine-dependent tRNA 4-demethylwyosine synthase n=1 Tax=Candidatus Sysuiplasma superficiale TaxID=2823368 RepID=A0A8J7YII4_9ARCH|nr:4-demethylwyosine synthase TYW1 [Candidatus Sysuiplasma superficiale]MBX8643211.1 4-demethylwyosine synthase TYW1 [Candidatus Sysuiplasma superficiale]MCL4346626.1 4-demethylwyosine synthase TYW1 [Candidatus Thermoplasmatota archaeon]